MGVTGFPTLKIVTPGKKPGRPIVEDYQGARTAKGIVDAVIDKIPNLVKRVSDKDLEAFLAEANDTAKAILFTDKGKTSALLKSIAIDFKGSISVAQIRNTEKASIELFGITSFPTLLLLPGGKEAEGVVYEGELKKEAMVKFLSQAAPPNPDPAPAKVKVQKPKKSKAAAKEEAFESASSAHASSEKPVTQTDEVLEEEPTDSPSTETETGEETEKPIVLPDPAPPIPILLSKADLESECLGPKTGTCILALLPASPDADAALAVGSLSEVAHEYHTHARKLFPFYVLPISNEGYTPLKDALELKGETEVIAVNGRRGWWKKFPEGKEVSIENVQNWVDAIRLGEGEKNKIPDGVIRYEEEEEFVLEETTVEEPEPEPVVEGETIILEDVKAKEPAEPIPEQEPVVVVEEAKVDEPAAEKTEEVKEEIKHGEL